LERPSWAPDEVNLDRPSVARVYDYYLGGSHNFAADRAFAEQVLQHMPQIPAIARIGRASTRRVVRYLCAKGIRQFIDLGSGIPTVGNVHEVAKDAGPDAKVVYVDNDPVAVAHSRAILQDDPFTAVASGDMRHPELILADAAVRKLIDFREPVAFLFIAVLHFVTDEERPGDIVAGYIAPAVPGSYVAIGQFSVDRDLTEGENQAVEIYKRGPTPLVVRTTDEIRQLFGDLTLVEPGVVIPPEWRPEPGDGELTPEDKAAAQLARIGLARKD
jgi:hypothetical protein